MATASKAGPGPHRAALGWPLGWLWAGSGLARANQYSNIGLWYPYLQGANQLAVLVAVWNLDGRFEFEVSLNLDGFSCHLGFAFELSLDLDGIFVCSCCSHWQRSKFWPSRLWNQLESSLNPN